MAVEIPRNEEISGTEKDGRKRSWFIDPSKGKIGATQALRKESEDDLFREILTAT